jgi:sarcosine oxidase delta subunit
MISRGEGPVARPLNGVAKRSAWLYVYVNNNGRGSPDDRWRAIKNTGSGAIIVAIGRAETS